MHLNLMSAPNQTLRLLTLFILAAIARIDLPAAEAIPTLEIQADHATAKVSPIFYGLMTEEINFSYEGGIYAELIRNRSFKADAVNTGIKPDVYDPTNYYPAQIAVSNGPKYWSAVGGAAMLLDTNTPLNEALNVSLKLDAPAASAQSPAGIANGGYWGIPVTPRTTYRVSFYAKAASGFTGPLTVSLETSDGKTTFATAKISELTGEWKRFQAKLTTKRVDPSKDNVFKITTTTPGTIWLQQVSLFPPTYHDRPNGNRRDLMEMLAGMQPKFLRLPGGNYVEGNFFNQHFNWKETIGSVEQRPGHQSCWGYWSTDGLGLLEFAEWCEDLKMEPVLAVFAGYALRGDRVEAGPKLQPYIQEALDEIEYLTGDAKTKWGAHRAKDGHRAPFPLHYVEIGNEDFFDRSGSYDGRFAQFFDAIKAKYPRLQIIATTPVKSRVADLIDEHYYRNQQEMEAQSQMYDTRSRTNHTKVFVGEWATRVGSPTPNMAGALGDAAWLCCMERNSDLVVVMECFAPLFVNVSQLNGPGRSMQWASDLIGYDALTSYGSPSYYVEKMFGQNSGDELLPVKAVGIPTVEQMPPAGRRGGTPTPRRVPGLYYSATRNSGNGMIYLKVVNVADVPQMVSVTITGVKSVARSGEAVVLAAGNLEETDSIQDPVKLVPVATKISDLGTHFTRTLPKFSVTILKFQARSSRSTTFAATANDTPQPEQAAITQPVNPPISATVTAPPTTASATTGNRPAPPVRIKAGTSELVKDAEGNVWLADQGFQGGQTLERADVQVANTKSPEIYRGERYSMDSFSWPVPNGKYQVKLHFAETYEGITGPGERVFSFNVQGHEFKDFDVYAKAGGPLRAYVESVNVEATNGFIKVTFTPKVENPQINGIEILPQP